MTAALRKALARYASTTGNPDHIAVIRHIGRQPATVREIHKSTGIAIGVIERAVNKLCRLDIIARAGHQTRPRGGHPISVYQLADRKHITQDPSPAPGVKIRAHPSHLTLAGQVALACRASATRTTNG